MTQVIDLINDALIEIGALSAGRTASAEDSALCLRRLNQIMQRWSNTRLMIPALTNISVPLTGALSYTIGPSGNVVAARPIKIEVAWIEDAGGVVYPVTVNNRQQWRSIAVKDVDGGPPSDIWYEALDTNGRVYTYPKASGYTLKMDCQVLLTSFSATTDTITLPDGYESALYLTLADEVQRAFGRPVDPDLRMRARGARNAVKATNNEPLLLTVDAAMVNYDDYRIERGF